MRILFMGTPDFAVPSIRALVEAGHDVCGAFTQPDKPKNRGMKLQPTPVKEYCLEQNIPVFQPTKLRDGTALAQIQELAPELIVVAAYGRILPDEILDYPAKGCINVHSSLLPRYRGAAPVQWAVLNGDTEAGVTTMLLDEGVDTGDMLLTFRRPLDDTITGGELFDLLAQDGADLLSRTLDELAAGTLAPTPQPTEGACYASMLDKSMCPLDWTKPARTLHNQVRGMNPWPVATCCVDGKGMKVFVSRVGDTTDAVPGTVVSSQPFAVACGDGLTLILDEIQAEGSRRMAAADYLRGHPITTGTNLID